METIIVEIRISALNEVVQFMLPAHVPVKALLSDIVRQICQLYPHVAYGDQVILYNMDKHEPIQTEWTLAQCGIQDGSSLELV